MKLETQLAELQATALSLEFSALMGDPIAAARLRDLEERIENV